MTKIKISEYDAASLAAARRAGESRRHLWSRIRDAFAIPPSVKLGMATDRSLYVKGSDPRMYLQSGMSGHYIGAYQDPVPTDYPTPYPSLFDAPAPAKLATDQRDQRFVVGPSDVILSGWFSVPLNEVGSFIHDDDLVEVDSLPEGFPKVERSTLAVFDAKTKRIYFRY